jgi:hypothetical protein
MNGTKKTAYTETDIATNNKSDWRGNGVEWAEKLDGILPPFAQPTEHPWIPTQIPNQNHAAASCM